jgi:hypothetical protein
VFPGAFGKDGEEQGLVHPAAARAEAAAAAKAAARAAVIGGGVVPPPLQGQSRESERYRASGYEAGT